MNRADLLYEVLKDGQSHSRRDIQRRVGFFLTNNAASELRKRGFTVTHSKKGGVDSYQLGSLQEPAARTEGQGLIGGGSWSEIPPTREIVGASAVHDNSLLSDAGPVTSPEEIGPASPYQLSIEEAA